MSEQHPEPKPFPISPDFPITWKYEQDAEMPWMYDRLHTPNPVKPLTGSLHEIHFARVS